MTYFYNERTVRTALHAYIIQILWDIYSYFEELKDIEDEQKEAMAIMQNVDIEDSENESEVVNDGGDGDGNDVQTKDNEAQNEEAEWNFARFVDSNEDLKFFIDTISDEIELHEPNDFL